MTPTKRLSYGILYVDLLIEEDNWEEAATFLQRLLVIKRDPNEIKSITQISTESNEEDLDKEILIIGKHGQLYSSTVITCKN